MQRKTIRAFKNTIEIKSLLAGLYFLMDSCDIFPNCA
jgi:hypothetical protein